MALFFLFLAARRKTFLPSSRSMCRKYVGYRPERRRREIYFNHCIKVSNHLFNSMYRGWAKEFLISSVTHVALELIGCDLAA